MRELNLPPVLRSTVDEVVCQSGEAVFQILMSSGVVYADHTACNGAGITVDTVICMVTPDYIVVGRHSMVSIPEGRQSSKGCNLVPHRNRTDES